MSIASFGRNTSKLKALLGIRARLVILALILVVPLMLDRVRLLEDSRWKSDWESWVGWSEKDLPTLKQEKPTAPVLVRVRLRETHYYNFEFKDESEWSSYQLSDPDLLETIYAYAPSLGELDLRLKPGPYGMELKVALRVRFLEGATSDNQLIIEEIVSDSWLVKEDTP